LISTIPEPALLMIALCCSSENDPVSAHSTANLHPLHTAPCPIHYSALHTLQGDSMESAVSCFSPYVSMVTLPGVLNVVGCVVTILILMATQAPSLSARSGLPTNTSVPVALSGSYCTNAPSSY
jgi:hypothetical protein